MLLDALKKRFFHLDFPHTFDGFHHYHLRKRREVAFEHRLKILIDKSVYVVGVLFPLMTVPQVWEIYSLQDASGVSLAMWIGGTLGSLYWLTYGVLHSYYPIVISSLIWTIINAMVIVGIIIYS